MIKFWILDSDNRPIEVANAIEWSRWFEDANRHVGYTQITSDITVSTAFLGVDHRYHGEGPPILFETLIFGGPLDGQCSRYVSWDDAEVGHRMLVAKVRAAIGQRIT
jgi:hypothetical protein